MKSGGGILAQQTAFEMEALKSARFTMAQAIMHQNHELAQLAVSELVSLANLDEIEIPAQNLHMTHVRLDLLRQHQHYFRRIDNIISKKLGEKWTAIRAKYSRDGVGVEDDEK